MVGLFLSSAILLQSRVVRVPTLIKELAEKSGQPLACSQEVQNDVLFLSLKPRDAQNLMDLIAKADAAEWVTSNGETTLTRTAKLKSAQERADRATTADRHKKAFDRVSKGIDFTPWEVATVPIAVSKEVEREKNTPRGGPPRIHQGPFKSLTERFLHRILTTTNFRDFVVPVGEQTVYSTSPTRMQRQLTVRPQDLKIYDAEMAALQKFQAGRTNAERDSIPEAFRNPWFKETPPVEPTEVRLTVQSYKEWQTVFTLSIFGPDHAPFDSALWADEQPAPNTAYHTSNYEKWKNSPAKPTAAAITFANPQNQAPALRFALKPLAAKPDDLEPTSLMLDNALQAIAKEEGAEMIFCVADEAAVQACMEQEAHPTLGVVFDTLEPSLKFEQQDSLIVGTPALPTVVEAERLDRAKLQGFIQELTRARTPNADLMANYAKATKELSGVSRLESTVLCGAGCLFLRALGAFEALTARDTLRFYAKLSPPQKEKLWSGAKIDPRDLGTEARKILERLVYRRQWQLTNKTGSIYDDNSPTWCWPDGLPANLELGSTTSTQAMVMDTNGQNAGTETTPSILGYFLGVEEKGGVLTTSGGYPNVRADKFLPYNMNVLQLILESPNYLTQLFITDYRDVGVGESDYKSLPPAFLAEFNKTLAATRNSQISINGNTGKIPPR